MRIGQWAVSAGSLRAELQASLDAGTPKSIADVAAEQGVALEAIESAILEQMSEKLAEKVGLPAQKLDALIGNGPGKKGPANGQPAGTRLRPAARETACPRTRRQTP